MSTGTDDRCGYQLEIGLATEDPSTGSCDRPVWEDHDRCIWHAKEDGKTMDQLEGAHPKSEEDINGAYLQEAELVGADWFADMLLIGADFTGAHLNGADFSGANLMLATLTSVSAINTDFSGATLEGATFTNADLRRATLEDALLNEAVFTDVHIGGATKLGEVSIYERDLVEPELGDNHPLEAASWAYRQLERIYQNNGLPEQAQQSYNREKNARRKFAWADRRYLAAIKWELARWVALYGSSPYRVLLTSVIVIVAAAVLFPLTGGIQEIQAGRTITYAIEDPGNIAEWRLESILFKSLYFSVVTFTTLGYGDMQPIGQFARVLAGVEALLGALLAALLVFVLARIVTW